MRSTSDERHAQAHFDDRCRVKSNAAAAVVEQSVIGAVWGANGYTTRDQADELARLLRVGPGDRLLDHRNRAGVAIALPREDLGLRRRRHRPPMTALQSARRRSKRAHVEERAVLVVASRTTLPFRVGQFDAVVHTDVLC